MAFRLGSLIARLLARPQRASRPTPPKRATSVTMAACPRCAAGVASSMSRCPHCGNRLVPAAGIAEAEPAAGEEKSPLTELEQKILLATVMGNRPEIHVLPPSGEGRGEVKAGDRRIYGDEAVEALETLVEGGLVTAADDTTLTLTPDGEQIARVLRHTRDAL